MRRNLASVDVGTGPTPSAGKPRRERRGGCHTTCAAGNEPLRRMIEEYVERYGGRHEVLLRQHSPRPGDEVTDQHRFTITEEEYREATADRGTLQFAVEW